MFIALDCGSQGIRLINTIQIVAITPHFSQPNRCTVVTTTRVGALAQGFEVENSITQVSAMLEALGLYKPDLISPNS